MADPGSGGIGSSGMEGRLDHRIDGGLAYGNETGEGKELGRRLPAAEASAVKKERSGKGYL